MNLPEPFVTNIRGAFGEAGNKFLSDLPALIEEASARWNLTDVRPVEALSYNFVAFATCGGEEVILKIGVPNEELTSEMHTLRLFAGQGACRLLQSDETRGMMLIERLKPGRMLASLEDDEQATHIAAGVMERIWRPAPAQAGFLSLRGWFDGLKRMRVRFGGGTGPLPGPLVEKAEGLVAEMFAEKRPDVLLHGDFHHYNLLESGRGWLVIDPKGVIGPAGYEVGPFLINPFDLLKRPDPVRVTRRRIDILAGHLGFGKEYIKAWGFSHAVLSAVWDLEGSGDWRFPIECAQMFESL